jgi:hypothetical protein
MVWRSSESLALQRLLLVGQFPVNEKGRRPCQPFRYRASRGACLRIEIGATRLSDDTSVWTAGVPRMPVADHLQAAGSPRHRYWISSAPLVANAGMDQQDQQLARRLRQLTQKRVHDPRVALVERNGDPEDERALDLEPLPQAVEISVQLADGSWLNAVAPLRVSTIPRVDEWWQFMLVVSLVLAIFVLVFAVRWIMRPLTALAEAADRVGRG